MEPTNLRESVIKSNAYVDSMAAPVGNQNASNARQWRAAIERALEARSVSRMDGKRQIDALAEKLIDAAETGDLGALKEFGDRLDGKPSQGVTVSGDADNPLKVIQKIERVVVSAKSAD